MKSLKPVWVVLGVLLQLTFFSLHAAEVEVVGIGADQPSAVANALSEAVRQVKGVQISSESIVRQLAASSSTRVNKDGERIQLDVDHLQAGQMGIVQLKSAGLVSRYRILSVRSAPEGGVEVRLAVEVASYRTPGLPLKRRRLAVLPFHVAQGARIQLPMALSEQELVRRLTHQIINHFTQSRRFAVLERDFGDEFKREEKLLLTEGAPVSELTRLGNLLGADYLVVGRIKSLYLQPVSRRIAVLDEVQHGWKAGGRLEYRIVTLANRQVKWSADVALQMDRAAARTLAQASDDTERLEVLLNKLARSLVDQAIQNIFPLRVVRVEGNQLILNEGGVRVRPGDRYTVYQLGAPLKDPYTGEPLGRVEKPVGEVEVVRVLPKYSVAVWRIRHVEGPLGDAVLRKPSDLGQASSSPSKPRGIQPIRQPSW